MKKLLVFFGIFVLGAVVTTAIDHLVGIKFTDDVGEVARIVHQVTYMLWGAALLGMNKWLEN